MADKPLERLRAGRPLGAYPRTVRKFSQLAIIVVLLFTGCSSPRASNRLSGLPLCYRNEQYEFTFFLPISWRGYSVLVQQWDSASYRPAADELVVMGHGPMITLRSPQWRANAPSQDIPILVFTRAQWDALHRGKLWPSHYAGGFMREMWHTREYVFGLSSRYNAADDVQGWKEVGDVVELNEAANRMPHLYPE